MKTKRRIYLGGAALNAGAIVQPCEEHAHYLINVLRLKSGDAVHVFNEQMGEWAGELRCEKREARIIISHQTRSPLASRSSHLTLAFAPLKKDRTDFLVEKASELGVHALQPVFTDHTQSERVNIERLQITAVDAAQQCDRLDAPKVLQPVKLADYLQLFRHPGEGRGPDFESNNISGLDPALRRDDDVGNSVLFLAAESGDAVPIAAAFSPLSPLPSHVSFLIGPEGGFSEKEFALFDRYPNIRRIRLGPRLLRAETAAAAVLSAFQAVTGDWQ